ncbi:dihydropteroate synthase [Granulosicoccaceae sp. 1_MG-2023]|nr:dihydropteroate synthase [Granulosicoccaceae sp. 1_MG-2023]
MDRFAAGRAMPACRVMGIVNVTPDSFSDGSRFLQHEDALAHARRLVAEGADWLDVGGESTRPGAAPVPLDEELRRVIPLIRAICEDPAIAVPVSVDTSKPEVMRAAIEAGAAMINDINALREPGAVEVCAEAGIPVCLMHMQGQPRTMQQSPGYGDVVTEVSAFLRERVGVCEAAGIARHDIVIDPGFGFGKTPEHNLALLKHLGVLVDTGYPVLAGLSRKSLFQAVLGAPLEERLTGSVTAALVAAQKGAAFVRVHDVKETCDALRVWQAIESEAIAAF